GIGHRFLRALLFADDAFGLAVQSVGVLFDALAWIEFDLPVVDADGDESLARIRSGERFGRRDFFLLALGKSFLDLLPPGIALARFPDCREDLVDESVVRIQRFGLRALGFGLF